MSIEFDDLQPNRVAVRANQKAALELVNAALKGKPHIFESWSEFILVILVSESIDLYFLSLKLQVELI